MTLVILTIIISQVLGHTNFNSNAQQENNLRKFSTRTVTMIFKVISSMSDNQVMVPDSNIFRVGYMDGQTLKQDTWYSWRIVGEELIR